MSAEKTAVCQEEEDEKTPGPSLGSDAERVATESEQEENDAAETESIEDEGERRQEERSVDPPDPRNNRHRCYILINDRDHKTYNGYTTDPSKRIRQHNGEIVGGAKFTTRHTKKDRQRGLPRRKWEYLAIVESPQFTYHNALSFEWHVKHPTGARKRPREFNGKNGRLRSLPLVFSHRKFRDMSFVCHVNERFYEEAHAYLYGETLDEKATRTRREGGGANASSSSSPAFESSRRIIPCANVKLLVMMQP